MRDIRRIWKFCNLLASVWVKLPDWRFGQLISNIFGQIKSEGIDPFFMEDDVMISYIEKYINKYTGITLRK